MFEFFVATGQYLYQAIQESEDLDVAFVWNRTLSALKEVVPEYHILEDLDAFADRYDFEICTPETEY